ncbi:hypothetical protein [Prosthecobacter dejongeii]|nr:hypothetical protein [Prosthecobacter dejongeii]
MALSRKWFWLFLAFFALMVEASALAEQAQQTVLPELVTEVLDTLSAEQETGLEWAAVDFTTLDLLSFRQGMCLGYTFRVWQNERRGWFQGTRLHRWLCIDLR